MDRLRQVGHECLVAALNYATFGWSLIPLCNTQHVGVGKEHQRVCKNRGKMPLVSAWQERPVATAEQLKEEWNTWPLANVGLVLGKIVRTDTDGDDAHSLLEAYAKGDLPPSLVYHRGREHPQYLFSVPPAEKWKTQVFQLASDHAEFRIQAEGAQCVLPPSLHSSGERYEWLPGCSPDDVALAPAPDWLCRIMRQKAAERNGRHKKNGRAHKYATLTPRKKARVVAHLATLEPAVSGQHGHDKLFVAARDLVWGFNVNPSTALDLLTKHYNPRCEPEWSAAELEHKVTEADTVPFDLPRGYLLDLVFTLPTTTTTTSNHSPVQAPPEDNAAAVLPTAGAELPTILIRVEEHAVNSDAIRALARHPQLYYRSTELVTVLRDKQKTKRIQRPAGSPRIAPLVGSRLREMLTEVACWVKKTEKNGQTKIVPAHPPYWSPPQILARGTWPEIRYLAAVVETPVLRDDGSLLDKAGWDADTGILYEPSGKFPPIPEAPTHADARLAAEALFDLVSDFPFKDDHAKAAWLCAALTPFARHAIAGNCPAVLFDSNVARSGKSKLADLVAILATGREMARTPWPVKDDAEVRKSITSIALAGDRLVLFDNIAEGVPFGGSALEAAITSATWKSRLLGTNTNTPELPLFTLFHASGNNTTLTNAIDGRLVLCQLECIDESPAERTGWKYLNLIQHAKQQRPALVAAALTILRAYLVAGRPDQKLVAFGSFEEWQALVQYAVYWTTDMDARGNRGELRERNDTKNDLAALLDGWSELSGADRGLTVAEAVRRLNENEQKALAPLSTDKEPLKYEALRELFTDWSNGKKDLNHRNIGNRIKTLAGQVRGGKRLMKCTGKKHGRSWRIEPL
jgi:hypothetical protein